MVDFKEFSAKTTLFAALSAAYPDRPLHRIDAVAAVSRFGTELQEVAARCVDELVAEDRAPEVVFGYCSAAGLALHIAAGLEARGLRRPPVILVEPSWLTPELVRRDVDALSGSEFGTYQGPADLSSIMPELRGPLERKLRDEGVDEEEIDLCVDIMAERLRAWFTFLVAAESADVPTEVIPVGVMLADDGARFPHPAWPEGSVRIEYLAGRSGELLGRLESMETLELLWQRACAIPR
ncbi:hypothetical protein [Streptacidiphilus pinicola]|uniref:hypothetical protein n=1 Tax=Streptacidiphilus pinicola TaxID=2219663 RepID=UPI001402CFF9|nr:hypothetical protein [Streptacidiphilus pinicola]